MKVEKESLIEINQNLELKLEEVYNNIKEVKLIKLTNFNKKLRFQIDECLKRNQLKEY